jgi:hypothetical protein
VILHELQVCNTSIPRAYQSNLQSLDVFNSYCCDQGEAVRLFNAIKKKEKVLVSFDEV